MQVFDKLNQKNKYSTAVALGLFDGIHLGHKKVINNAVKSNLKSAVLSFTTKMDRPTKKKQQKDILTIKQRISQFKDLGVDYVYIPDFDEIKNIEPKNFVKDILHDIINAKIVFCGQDFKFGKNALGDVNILKDICKEFGIEVFIVQQEYYDNEVVSSTRIRKLLAQGDIELANKLLGYNYYIEEVVTEGKKLGRTINYPTINQDIDEKICLPKFGVYVSSVEIDGKTYNSITNIGIKPTIKGERKPLAETHIIGYDGDLYGKSIKVLIYKFVRDEQKFDTIEQLKDNISRDVNSSIKYFDKSIDKLKLI